MSVRPHDGGDDGKVGPRLGYGDIGRCGKLCGCNFVVSKLGFTTSMKVVVYEEAMHDMFSVQVTI